MSAFLIRTTFTTAIFCLLAASGIRKIRLHDRRHTFGSLLIRSGASIVYVKEQMGHSSIQVTVDTYGHLIPGANGCFVDGLDDNAESKLQPAATPRNHAKTPRPRFLRMLLICLVAAVVLEPSDQEESEPNHFYADHPRLPLISNIP
jgi:hypothetical protein